MNGNFSQILQGLINNRRLTCRVLSRASGRAESTLNQLLSGRIAPNTELLQDIAPALQMPIADLLVIAGLPTTWDVNRAGRWRATLEIGSLVAAASWLTADQVQQVTALAQKLKEQNGDRS
jgi:transcriptional regulator with XRE-family HTH domain